MNLTGCVRLNKSTRNHGNKGRHCDVLQPTAPVATVIAQIEPPKGKPGFDKFDFEGRL